MKKRYRTAFSKLFSIAILENLLYTVNDDLRLRPWIQLLASVTVKYWSLFINPYSSEARSSTSETCAESSGQTYLRARDFRLWIYKKRNLRTAVRICSGLLFIYCALGPAFMISIGILPNFWKFLANREASLLADSKYFCLSDHVLIGSRI